MQYVRSTNQLFRVLSAKALLAMFIALAGCAHSTIPGTRIEDTAANREIFELVKSLEEAMVRQDVDKILAMVSPAYFEDMGTVKQDDDFGYEELRDVILPQSMAATKEMHLEIEVQDIVIAGARAHADVRYKSRAQIDLPSGAAWDSHKDFNRIEFSRENGAWRVISGL